MIDLFRKFWQDWGDIIGMSIWFVLFAGLLPILALFFGGGAERSDLLQTFIFYTSFGGIFLVGLIALRIFEVFSRYVPNGENTLGWANAVIHDEEKGLLKAFFPSFHANFSNYVIVSFIVFAGLGIIATVTGTFFVAIPPIEQQVTETSQIIMTAEPAASTETLVFVFVYSILFGLLMWGEHRGFYPKEGRWGLMILLVLVMTAFWTGFHLVRYGSQETSLLTTAIFGFVGAITMAFFGSFIPWYIFHFTHNLFAKLNELFSNDFTIIIIVLLILIVGSTYLAFELSKTKKEQFEDFT